VDAGAGERHAVVLVRERVDVTALLDLVLGGEPVLVGPAGDAVVVDEVPDGRVAEVLTSDVAEVLHRGAQRDEREDRARVAGAGVDAGPADTSMVGEPARDRGLGRGRRRRDAEEYGDRQDGQTLSEHRDTPIKRSIDA
jgi:hypothetical protein